MTKEELKNKIYLGKVDGYKNGRKQCKTYITIELSYNEENKPVLSICGEVWNTKKTDTIQSGQCIDSILNYMPNNQITRKLHYLWNKHHLNDMHAGTPEQEKVIKNYFIKNNKRYDYTEACEVLKNNNMYEVKLNNGSLYKYGNGWLYEEIPESDMEMIEQLLSFSF